MQTISSIFKAAAQASAAGQSPGQHLERLKAVIGGGDFYDALEKSLQYGPGISTHIGASDTPIATAIEVNQMSEERRRELTFAVDLGL